jgi:catechol 2,3-dioxygenase
MTLPADTHVGAVHLQVADLGRSIGYYERVIGLLVHAENEGAVTLGAHDDTRPLVHLREKPGVAPAPRRGAFGLFHFAILLPDRPSLGRFVSHLARLNAHAGSADHLVSEALYLTDPDGLGIEVYADRPRETWKYVLGELQMATDPLDLEDLRVAAAGCEWTGAPAGTMMGHVHLHVGNIEQAATFYEGEIGFDTTVRSYPGARFFSAGGYHHHLAVNTWSPGPAATDDQARLLEWELVVPGAAPRALADPWGTRVSVAS